MKKLNTRRIGRITELLAKKELEKEGYKVYLIPPNKIWSKNQDIFFLFDMLVCKGDQYKLIQVKTNNVPSLKPFIEFKEEHGCDNLSIEIWIYFKRGSKSKIKGWKRIII